MRRVTLFAFVLFCLWVVGCTHFITQPKSQFFSVDGGPNRDAFDKENENADPKVLAPAAPDKPASK